MEVSYFYFIVLPLGIIVGILAPLVLFYARREELAQWKLKRLLNAHLRKRVKHKETLTKEIENLGILLRNGSIDETTYERLKIALCANYERYREEAMAELAPMLEKSDAHHQEKGLS